MKATIYSHKTAIGNTDLQISAGSMGSVFGQFVPNENYFRDIQQYVWDFWATNKPDYSKWYSLRFNAQLENGFFLFPEGGYTFEDFPENPNEPKRIALSGIDFNFLTYSNDTLLEPWYSIDIAKKLSLEDELTKEINLNLSNTDSLKLNPTDNHILLGAEYSCLANYGPNDDVLFVIKKQGEISRLATVHLTWISRNREHSTYYPATHFYQDFEDFSNKRMKPDHAGWES